MVVLHLQTFPGLSFKLDKQKSLFCFYGTMLGWAQALVKSGRCRREEENRGKCLRCYAFIGKYMGVFCRAVSREGLCLR